MKSTTSLFKKIEERAISLGLDVFSVADLKKENSSSHKLQEFIDNKYHGDMDWLSENVEIREDPLKLWPIAKTAIVLGMNYGPSQNPLKELEETSSGYISVYARGRDYHQIIKGKLKNLASFIVSISPSQLKIFVDTGPIMEKPLAEKAGLGWQGKHTNLVSKDFGSWLFLGVILTNIPYNKVTNNSYELKKSCGSCSACIDICPTNAFPQSGVLDARKCISYLTIENKGHIDIQYREKIGNRIFGCDDCLAVCPWNKFASTAKEIKLHAKNKMTLPHLSKLVSFDEVEFRKYFSKSPLKRLGFERFLRNVLLAIGNSSNQDFSEDILNFLTHESTLVRAMAVWSLSKIDFKLFLKKRKQLIDFESDKYVLNEWFLNKKKEKISDIA